MTRTAEAPTTTQIATSTGGNIDLMATPEGRVSNHWVRAPADKIWTVLPSVYEELGIEPRSVDRSRWEFGNREVRVSRRLAGESLAAYLDCGNDPIGGPAANTYAVRMDLITRLQPSDAGTAVLTRVNATAAPRSGTATDTRCTSTGRLEERIAKMVGSKVSS